MQSSGGTGIPRAAASPHPPLPLSQNQEQLSSWKSCPMNKGFFSLTSPSLADTARCSNEFLMLFNRRNSHECFMTRPAGSGWRFVLSLSNTRCVVAQPHPVLGSCCEDGRGFGLVWIFSPSSLCHLEFRPERLQICPRSHLGSASDPFPCLCCTLWLWSVQRTVDGAGAPVGKEGTAQAQNPARASSDSSSGHRAGEGLSPPRICQELNLFRVKRR